MKEKDNLMQSTGINRRDFIKSVGMGTIAFGIFTPMQKVYSSLFKNERPNIILVMADDVSPDLYGCYGNTEVKTPNLDRMAKEGVMFQTCWATAMCSPTRAEIMTGRYGSRTGFYHNSLKIPQPDGSLDLLKHHHSFAKLLRQEGYATAISGKWHLGSGVPYNDDGGFEEYCLWESIRAIKALPGSPKYSGGWENEDTTARYWHPGIVQNGRLLPTNPDDFGPDIFTNFLCEFMERKKNQPFLAYYPMVAPHGTRQGHTTTPLKGKVGDIAKKSQSEEKEKFKALNEYVDVLIGRIWNKVEELDLVDRTIIMFTSDNGTAVTAKTRGVERGCRVPFIVYGAGIKKRGTTAELTDLSDIFPTLLEFAGAKIPDGYIIDGKSLKPFLEGQTEEHREWIYSFIATTQLVRTKNYLLEAVNDVLDLPKGRFYYCGNHRDGHGYENVTNSQDPEIRRACEKFDKILKQYPPLTEDHPFLQSKRGKKFLEEYTQPAAVKKHLYNHSDYKFYKE